MITTYEITKTGYVLAIVKSEKVVTRKIQPVNTGLTKINKKDNYI